MPWELSKQFRFEASHTLRNHSGKCGTLHGHSWVGKVVIRCLTLQTKGSRTGMGVDYADISAALKPLVEHYLDHHNLNDTLATENPTSEVIAEWVYNMLHSSFEGISGVKLWAVEISETCTNSCRYYVSRSMY